MPVNLTTSTSPHPLKTAVLFLVFNRLDTTKEVFEAIRQAKPPRLYIAADGARASRVGEAATVQAVRDYVVSHIDWECEVKTLFRDKNLGCKYAVSGAITWFFENEEMGIILEDDCLPRQSFFGFCEALLERYKHDQRISQISGVNLQSDYLANDDSYYFSRINNIWGWASWRDRWQDSYDIEMKKWPRIRDEGRMADWLCSSVEEKYWTNSFEQVYIGKINTWDYQWVFGSWLQGRLSVMPRQNLISNIGFGPDATHTTEVTVLSNLQAVEMQFPLRHSESIFASRVLEMRFLEKICIVPLHRRVTNKICRLIQKLRATNASSKYSDL
jgi:hypothetical protein